MSPLTLLKLCPPGCDIAADGGASLGGCHGNSWRRRVFKCHLRLKTGKKNKGARSVNLSLIPSTCEEKEKTSAVAHACDLRAGGGGGAVQEGPCGLLDRKQ